MAQQTKNPFILKLDYPKVSVVLESSLVHGVNKLSNNYFKLSSEFIWYQNPTLVNIDMVIEYDIIKRETRNKIYHVLFNNLTDRTCY